MARQFTTQNFETEVLLEKLPVLVDFYADWCGPCKMMAPVMDELTAECESWAVIGKLNVDDAQEIAAKYEVLSIPTFIVFKDGKAVQKAMGTLTKDKLLALLKEA